MNPVCRSSKPTKFKLNKEKGQLSVFLGISMTIIVTLLAFIINVGLFVKAKINLQNATDAAAWSGASVQARQLTNIAYLNWEMRNNYKEWMFKSYVLGQLALSTVKDTGITPNNGSSNNMQFRGKPFDPTNPAYQDEYERFNLPSICIHFGSTHNICDLVRLPGLPRFNTVGLPSISAHHESVLTSLVDTKAKDCSRRTATNFGAALLWAYGTGKPGLSFSDMPLIASRRVGAWVKGMELGLRMRNLEAQVNVPPISDGICFGCNGGVKIGDINASFPGNERPIKAFWSGLRSLGGGDLKLSGDRLDNFSFSFKLTELEPNKVEYSGSKTLSNYLIPNTPVGGQGYNANTKYFLDLQAYPLNLVSFFTTFVSSTGTYNGTVTEQEADCGGSKTGLPVPGFLFGFVKNPELMTYYAVKSEAKFVGLFNPFADDQGITLNAYAAAKPFGGRIGPKLFSIKENKSVTARTVSSINRSAAYLSAPRITADMKTAAIGDKYKNGNPIPLTDNFWIQSDSDPVGGTPDSGDVFFSVPNLLYEFDDSTMEAQVSSGPLSFTERVTSILSSQNPVEILGLHSKSQFNSFKANFSGSTTDAAITQDTIEDSINRVRRPTKYDAVNYLIPVVPDSGSPLTENIPFVRQNVNCPPFPPESKPTPCYNIYAPLYGDGTLFQDATATQEIIAETVDRFKPAVEKFINSLKEVSESILAQSSRGPGAYQAAADSIYTPGLLPNISNPLDPQCTGASLAQNFNHFFNGTSKACDITPLVTLIVEYLDSDNGANFATHHTAPLSGLYEYPSSSLMTAYMPGPRQGAQADGNVSPPLSGGADAISARRSAYSTKFVPLERLVGGVDGYAKNGQWMMIEESLTNPPGDLTGVIKNPLKKGDLDLWDKLFF
jgi:hypothetical protein